MKKRSEKKIIHWNKVFKMVLYALIFGVIIFSLVYVILDHYRNTNFQRANPASEYCIEQGGELIFENSSDGVYGVCIFGDGTKCEEWDFYNGNCNKGDSIYLTFSDYHAAIDTSCNSIEDCVIKDVRNCCGYYPKCVNKNFEPASPEFVAKRCELEGLFSSCGFPAFEGCECRDHNCVSV